MSGDWLRAGAMLLAVVLGLFAFVAMVAARRAPWALHFRDRRWHYLLLIAAAVLLAKVTEDVLAHESGALDKALLLDIHREVPARMLGFFTVATLTGSLKLLGPITGIGAAMLWLARRRFEALQLVVTMGLSSLVIYAAKTAVSRVRPSLWETQWYWGSSFPSGHTLSSAALATSAFLCVSRQWPRLRAPAACVLSAWVVVVGASRLVLGVHWPTDVIAAACAGALLAAGTNAALLTAWREARR